MNSSENLEKMLNSPSYRLAYEDIEFLSHETLRPVRLQLELQKPDMIMDAQGIQSTVVVFGSARLISKKQAENKIAELQSELRSRSNDSLRLRELAKAKRQLENAKYYEEARRFAKLVSTSCQIDGKCDFVVVTGGGPGIMEAANLGAFETNSKSIGLNITLPFEEYPNPYITPELCFQFQYFAIRKMHFLLRAKALVAFPGGFGTLDELFETLTLIQTRRLEPLPVLLFGEEFWNRAVDFEFLVEQGMIGEKDLGLIEYVKTAEEAWQKIIDFYVGKGKWPYQTEENNRKDQLYAVAE
ncbi:MAG: LOG family protein [bacterium]